MNENLKWNFLKEKVKQASEMKHGEFVSCEYENGMKTVNILSL